MARRKDRPRSARRTEIRPVRPREAVAYVERHGIVLESARGPVPNLAEAVAGEVIVGGWWGHPRNHAIFAAARAARDSPDVLVCRLVDKKITYVHRRLWPALVRLSDLVGESRLAAIKEEHTRSGAHRVTATPFPQWVPREVRLAAQRLTENEAVRHFPGPWSPVPGPRAATTRARRHRRGGSPSGRSRRGNRRGG